jgi:hypothetical protein
MKYLVNENNTCGQASLTDDLRNMVLEGMGYTVKKEEVSEQINESVAPQAEVEENYDMPTLYEWDGSVFALDDEVFEIEGDLFLKAIELDSETRMSLDESHADLFINEVKFEETDFSLGDIYDYGDEIFIKLDEAYAMKEGDKKGDKSKDKPKDKPEDEDDKEKVVKEEEDPKARVKRQVANLNLNTPRGRERAAELKRGEKARKLDRTNPITKPSQNVASDEDAKKAAQAHGDDEM